MFGQCLSWALILWRFPRWWLERRLTHVRTHVRNTGTETLCLMGLLLLFLWLWKMSLTNFSHRPPPHCHHFLWLLPRKGHVPSAPCRSQKVQPKQNQQLLDSEEHPWSLQISFWEDSLLEFDPSYTENARSVAAAVVLSPFLALELPYAPGAATKIKIKCQEGIDVLIHQISTSGLEIGLKLKGVHLEQRKRKWMKKKKKFYFSI